MAAGRSSKGRLAGAGAAAAGLAALLFLVGAGRGEPVERPSDRAMIGEARTTARFACERPVSSRHA